MVAIRILGFIFRIYLTRILGAQNLGVYQTAFSFFISILTIFTSGIPLIISRITAKTLINKDNTKRYEMVSSSIVITFISSIILSIIIIILKNDISKLFTDKNSINILLALLPAIIFSSVYSILRGDIWGQKRYLPICIIELNEEIIRIIVCILFINLFSNKVDKSIICALSLSFACFISLVLTLIIYFKYGEKLYKPKHFKEIFLKSLPITLIKVASSLTQPLIAILIPYSLIKCGYTSFQAMEQYGIVMGMVFPLLFLPITVVGSLSMTLVPNLAGAVEQKNNKYIERQLNYSIKFCIIISCLFLPIFLALSNPLCEFLYSNNSAGNYLSISCFTMVFFSLENITTTTLNSIGKEKFSFYNYLIGTIFLILSILFLPKIIGINALIVGIGVSSLIVVVLNLKVLKNSSYNIQLNYKELAITFIIIIIVTILTKNIYTLLPFTNFFNLALSSLISIICYILLCETFGIIKVYDVIKQLK
jgi:stage V sporulation protein B